MYELQFVICFFVLIVSTGKRTPDKALRQSVEEKRKAVALSSEEEEETEALKQDEVTETSDKTIKPKQQKGKNKGKSKKKTSWSGASKKKSKAKSKKSTQLPEPAQLEVKECVANDETKSETKVNSEDKPEAESVPDENKEETTSKKSVKASSVARYSTYYYEIVNLNFESIVGIVIYFEGCFILTHYKIINENDIYFFSII